MGAEQRCGNCGYLGKAFPWCRAFKKAVKVTEGADCLRWSVSGDILYRPEVVAPQVPVQDEHPTEARVEADHLAAIEESMRREALAWAFKVARHAGYVCGGRARAVEGQIKNPYRQYSQPAKEWAAGYERGLSGLEED